MLSMTLPVTFRRYIVDTCWYITCILWQCCISSWRFYDIILTSLFYRYLLCVINPHSLRLPFATVFIVLLFILGGRLLVVFWLYLFGDDCCPVFLTAVSMTTLHYYYSTVPIRLYSWYYNLRSFGNFDDIPHCDVPVDDCLGRTDTDILCIRYWPLSIRWWLVLPMTFIHSHYSCYLLMILLPSPSRYLYILTFISFLILFCCSINYSWWYTDIRDDPLIDTTTWPAGILLLSTTYHYSILFSDIWFSRWYSCLMVWPSIPIYYDQYCLFYSILFSLKVMTKISIEISNSPMAYQ